MESRTTLPNCFGLIVVLSSSPSPSSASSLQGLAAHQHLLVAAVVHQPSARVFTLFHDVLLLGSGGATAYAGPVSGALPYFEVHTRAFATRAARVTAARALLTNVSVQS